MKEFLINTLIWTFALYGLFEIIKNIIYMYTYTGFRSDGTYLLVLTKNQEDYVESLLRTILFKIMYGKEQNLKNIIVVDLNSKDKTKEIIMKLAQENEYLKSISWKECKELIDNLNDNI